MSLKEYRSKRDLKKSREPKDTSKRTSGALNFCIQKHAARRLHYDFRIEHRGVLVSWAVPKGPSLNPQDKRLAIKVEDHPLDYQYFEGTIPKGHYGAGTVEIWDRGTYTLPDANTREEVEKGVTKGLKQGHLSVILKGERLQGEFVFQKLKKDPDDNAWLVIKKGDVYASSKKMSLGHAKGNLFEGTSKTAMPTFVAPMLATLVKQPFSNPDWLFEIKWDGYRALAFIKHGTVQLKSRSKNVWNQKFPEIVKDLQTIGGTAILDGELVVLDSKGRSRFQLMQNYEKDGKGTLCYYVFDLLYKDGHDLRQLPLIERKEILKKFLKDLSLPLIRFSDHVINDGEQFFKEASKHNLEGIIGKKIVSTYQSRRSPDWVKIKTVLRQEVVICGFTAPRGTRKKFGALLVGINDKEKGLQYAGHVGGGFNAALLQTVYKKLQPLIQKKSPFKNPPKANAPVTWVKPKLVCEVSFAEWTEDNIMRQPIFQGLRDDKPAKAVVQEFPKPISANKTSKSPSSANSKELTLTHLDKIYWPNEGYSKGDLIHYYESVANYILPYLKERPIVLHRYPDGIEGQEFYQKDINFSHPDWIKTFPLKHEGKVDNYLLINDERSLLYAVNLGSIDLHPFLSRCKKLEYPDYCVIDLDPHGIPFERVVDTALLLHDTLERVGVKHYCKTSGGKGLHIVIPLHGKYHLDQSQKFAEVIALYIHQQLPEITSIVRNPKRRQKKIYLDCLQNRYGQTIVAPYAVRPRPMALVSTPLTWDEVNRKLDPSKFNIKTVLQRLKRKGDLFKPVLREGINMQAALKRIEKLLSP